MTVEFSWRYGVVGVYRGRDRSMTARGITTMWRVYPAPFVRVSFETYR